MIYNTIKQKSNVELVINKSKFIGYVSEVQTIQDIEKELGEIKNLHPKATHHCYAYRLGLSKDNYRANDDGEPNGTAGLPILNQIDSAAVTNTFVVVVRYYGGTKLGASGLISAYKNTAKEALVKAESITKEVQNQFEIHCDYLVVNDVLNYLKRLGVSNWEQDYSENCKISFPISAAKSVDLIQWLEKKNVQFKKNQSF